MKRARFDEFVFDIREQKRIRVSWLKLVDQYKGDATAELMNNYRHTINNDICPRAQYQDVDPSVENPQPILSCLCCCEVFLWTNLYGRISAGRLEYNYDMEDDALWPWSAQRKQVPYMAKDVVLLIATYACMDVKSLVLVCKGWKKWIYGCKSTRMAIQQRLTDRGFYIPSHDVAALCIQTIPTKNKKPSMDFKNIKHPFLMTVVHGAFVCGRKIRSAADHSYKKKYKYKYLFSFDDDSVVPLSVFVGKGKRGFQVDWDGSRLKKSIGYDRAIQRWNDVARGWISKGLITHWKK